MGYNDCMKTNKTKILAANKAGQEDRLTGEWMSYYTPVYQVAYNLGQDGIDLAEAPLVSGYRYGEIPESGISRNYADDISERGLSLAALDGGKEIGSSVWFADRKRVAVLGLLMPHTGSDGEPIILPVDVEDLD